MDVYELDFAANDYAGLLVADLDDLDRFEGFDVPSSRLRSDPDDCCARHRGGEPRMRRGSRAALSFGIWRSMLPTGESLWRSLPTPRPQAVDGSFGQFAMTSSG
jgi:hypothetical protein